MGKKWTIKTKKNIFALAILCFQANCMESIDILTDVFRLRYKGFWAPTKIYGIIEWKGRDHAQVMVGTEFITPASRQGASKNAASNFTQLTNLTLKSLYTKFSITPQKFFFTQKSKNFTQILNFSSNFKFFQKFNFCFEKLHFFQKFKKILKICNFFDSQPQKITLI